jgi:hypothetical protein
MSWNPFRRSRDTVEIVMQLPGPTCANCESEFRSSPGNWHCESKEPGICNRCHYAIQDRLRRPYGSTKIGF